MTIQLPSTPISKSSFNPTTTKDADRLFDKVHELSAENCLLEKEVANYRKEMAQEARTFQDQMRSALSDQKRLKELNFALEDKLSFLTKEKLDFSLQIQSLKAQLKEVVSERDKLERDYTKEIHRFETGNSLLRDANRALTKEKIDLANSVAILQKKYKDSETLCAKYERELNKDGGNGNVSTLTLKNKDFEIQRLKRKLSQKVHLEQIVEEMEERIKTLETENTVLEMKVQRLSAAHEYACELEETIEEMKLQRTNVESDQVVNDLSLHLKQLTHEE